MIANDRSPAGFSPGLHTPLMFVQGAYPGPRLLVSGPRDAIEGLAGALWDLDGLGGIRGVLILRADDQPTGFDRADNLLTINDDPEIAYRRTLGRMTALGMISGRAVPRRWVA